MWIFFKKNCGLLNKESYNIYSLIELPHFFLIAEISKIFFDNSINIHTYILIYINWILAGTVIIILCRCQ